MSRRWTRALLLLLGVPNVITGAWALFAPRNWFDNFPGWAPRLVAALPPYNEHLVTDAGSGLLGAGVLAMTAAAWMRRDVIITAMVGFLAIIGPHALWHASNPAESLSASEDTLNAGSLVVAAVVAAVVLTDTVRTRDRPNPTPLAG